jgi:hypothetical protein
MSKTLKECMHRNDWPKCKDVLKAKLDLLENHNVIGLVVLTQKMLIL